MKKTPKIVLFLNVIGALLLIASLILGIKMTKELTVTTPDPAYVEKNLKYPRLYPLEDAPNVTVTSYVPLVISFSGGLFLAAVCFGMGAAIDRLDDIKLCCADFKKDTGTKQSTPPSDKINTNLVLSPVSAPVTPVASKSPDSPVVGPVTPIDVDLTSGKCTCPQCGQRQNTGRICCFFCGAEFKTI